MARLTMPRVYLDTCCLIYLIEDVPNHSDRMRDALIQHADAILCISPLVKLEVMTKPLQEANTLLANDYEVFLNTLHWLSMDHSVFDLALDLRVRNHLKTPDALHLATAIRHDCAAFWTNDERLSKIATRLSLVNVLATC